MIEKRKNFIINTVYLLLILAMAYFAVKYLYMWLFPFVIGFFVAMTIQRPKDFIHKKTKIPEKIIAIVMVVLILSAVAFIIYGLASWLISELKNVVNYLAAFFKDFPSTVDSLREKYPAIFSYLDGTQKIPFINIETISSKGSEFLADIAKGLTNSTFNFAKSLPTILISLIITIVSCCYFSIDYYNVATFLKRQLSHKARHIVTESKRIFYSSIFKFIKAYGLIILITFCELSIALLIMRVDNAIPLAALISIVDILPVLGVGTVLIPWGIVNLVLGNYLLGAGILITYIIITVIRNMIEPKIVGDYVGLHPLITLMSMYVGVKLFGGIGIIVLPFTLIVLNQLNNAGTIKLGKPLPKNPKQKKNKEKKEKEKVKVSE
jgi:sporulation integral membrane protein YtvI